MGAPPRREKATQSAKLAWRDRFDGLTEAEATSGLDLHPDQDAIRLLHDEVDLPLPTVPVAVQDGGSPIPEVPRGELLPQLPEGVPRIGSPRRHLLGVALWR